MTPQLAALRIHEHEALAVDYEATETSAHQSGSLVPFPVRRTPAADGGEHAREWLVRRDARHRRLLGAGDLVACALAMVLVLALMAHPALLLTLPAAIVIFKVAGLY